MSPELTTAIERMLELLAQIAATLERIEAQGERQIELLRSLDRSQRRRLSNAFATATACGRHAARSSV